MASSGPAYPEAVGCSCWLQLLQISRQFTRRICGRQAVAAVPIDPEAAAAVPIDHEADEAAAKNCKDIHQAAKEGNVGAVRHFLRVDPESLERKDGVSRTPLHWVAWEGRDEVVALLLRSGASVEAKDKDGWTALHYAARRGHCAVVEQLISAGATVYAATKYGRTALHYAAPGGHAAVVEQLISAGATVDAADNNGETPLHEAAREGHAAVVEQLISAGATVDAADNNGQTPYDVAEINGHRQVMGLLRPVFVALLSGRSCRCDPSQERTVLELKEEAEKKLGVKVKHLIGQNQEPLDESMELAAAHIVPGNTLTAVISEDVLEEGHPEAQAPAQPADPSMSEDGVEIKDFPHGIRLMAQQAIFEGFDPQIEVLENWNDLKEVSALEEALPAGHVPLARLLRLTPEDRTFPAPVKVQVPACAGADTVWRSTPAGWEKLDTVTFDDGRATVALGHFCDLAITGKCIPLKGLGFVHPEGANAQIVIMHIGCESCQRGLELLCSDEDVLQPLRKCGPSVQLGTFQHNEELEIHQAGRTSKIKMQFDKMPLSRRLYAQSGLQFDVEIDGENHVFEAPLVPGPPATPAPQPAPHPSGHPAGSAPQAPAVAGGAVGSSTAVGCSCWLQLLQSSRQFTRRICGRQASSAAMTGDMESAAPLRHAAGRGLKRLCVSGQPPSAAVAGSVASTDRGHLMLSGRFNSDAIVAYMKEVKSQLETRNVPVFMVDASTGQDFGQMTCEGLYRAKGMVAFCTSEYGAYTGVGYETFYELEFAHQNQLPLFPIRLCDQWPPAPQNNERGTHENRLVFKKSLVFAEDRQMTNTKGVADQIAESVARMGIFRN